MTQNHDKTFVQQRTDTFDRVIALVDARIQAATAPVARNYSSVSLPSLQRGAEKEIWSLFLAGIKHLKNGAPAGQPGSLTEALSRASLRSGTLAAALQIRPPQFEQTFFGVDATTGHEQALFLCRRLIEAAEGDLPKSRQIIQQKISVERPAAFGAVAQDGAVQAVKQQMVITLKMLTDTYGILCREFKAALTDIASPVPPSPSAKKFDL